MAADARRLAITAVAVALTAAGCGASSVPPPGTGDAVLREPIPTVPGALPVDQQLDFERAVEQFVVRVRGVGCDTGWTGSGFAVEPGLFVTNRHVVAGADRLEASTYDGHEVAVREALAAPPPLADLAVVTVDGTLPKVAPVGPAARPGQRIVAIGFPRGGKLTFHPGRVIDYVAAPDGAVGRVFRIDASVTHGNSGGPVVDMDGRVLGVVYRLDDADARLRLAIPISTLGRVVSLVEPAASLPCG